MAVQTRPAPRRPKPPRTSGTRPARTRANTRLAYDITGIILIALGLIVLGTLLSPGGQGGGNIVGSAIVRGLRLLVGLGAWLFPLVLCALGGMLAIGKSRSWDNAGAALTLYGVLLGWWHLGHVAPDAFFTHQRLWDHGGIVGAVIAWCVWRIVGVFGAHVVFLAGTGIAGLYLVDIPLPSLLGPFERLVGEGARRGKGAALVGARRAAEQLRERAHRPATPRPERERAPRVRHERPSRTPEDSLPTERGKPIPVQPSLFFLGRDRKPEPEREQDTADVDDDPIVESPPAPLARAKSAAPVTNVTIHNAAPTVFKLPPTNLLAPARPNPNPQAGASEERRQVILQTLEDFGIGADVENVSYGPTITRYEVALDRGIKVSKIVSLADNLAMALAAIDVRVEAPIPGKSAIGIEVPNQSATAVALRECLESPVFKDAPAPLTFVLGKDVTGAVRVADLAKMPHLLIAGSTGSGKSAGLNVLISSLLYRNNPRQLKLLMIDPKKVELSLYEGIPHLASPVITNVKQAPSLFKQAIKEMEARYDKFQKFQTRNIEGYNAKVEEEEKIPYWVIVVDELADLMMTSGPEIEQSICRLAQLARATGIHLVIATQRPSVNIITGTIKANISSRIAFAMNSAVDSRTILDQVGADRLIGRGDLLFMPMDAAKPQRIQGAWISEQETEALVNFLKNQGQPHFEVLPSTLATSMGDDESGEGEADDDLFEAAVKLVVTGGSASTSMLQRRFKIGYTRAARLVDLMEQKGIVGPLDGAKPREVRMSRDEVEAMFLPPGLE